MTTTTTITTMNQKQRAWRDEEDDTPSGCFGILRLRSSSSSLRSQQSRDRSTPPRPKFNPAQPGTVFDALPPATTDMKGYSIQGKSAELLGLMPKAGPGISSRTSSPVPWRSLSHDAASLRSQRKGASSLRSEKSSDSLDVKRWPVASGAKKVGVDPLDAVRRRIREESAVGTSVNRSSSAPAPNGKPTRNYSRKWRKSQKLEVKEIETPRSTPRNSTHTGKDFFDATSSVNTPIKEDEIPDTNKFDKLLTPSKPELTASNLQSQSQRSSARIRSAAFTTFAWMELQEETLALMASVQPPTSEPNRSSWLLMDAEKLPSPTGNGNLANESKKRSAHATKASSGSNDSVKRDDKRDTLEWMGVKPGDFPVPVIAAA